MFNKYREIKMSNDINTMVSQRKKKILRLHYDFTDIRSYSRDHGGVGSDQMYEILNDRYEAARLAGARARQLMRRGIRRFQNTPVLRQ